MPMSYLSDFNADILKKDRIILKHDSEDEKADIFAAEFLMPEDYVKEVFYKIVNVDMNKVLPRHVVRMNNYFKVSYKAMLKRLIQLELCSTSKYEELDDICLLENTEQLQSLTIREGYNIDLIVPSRTTYVSKEYIEFIKSKKNISYKNMKTMSSWRLLINLDMVSPEDFL